MRVLFLLPAVALAACQVTKSDNQTTVEYNQDVAENVAADVANGAKEAGTAIANSAKDAGAAIKNVDVDVNVDTNKADNDKAKNSN